MTDTERIDALENFIKKNKGNGIAIMPLNSCTIFSIDDLGDEDGTNLAEEFATGSSLRDVIDKVVV